ncbi:MAG: hypothetical protein WC481_01065 [Candidatus Omnitrophota bacterium]
MFRANVIRKKTYAVWRELKYWFDSRPWNAERNDCSCACVVAPAYLPVSAKKLYARVHDSIYV